MYPLGVLFGLGFDTSSEIALLGISSIQGAKGTSIWLILMLPVLFAAGMCLLDTADGALMMALYTSTTLARDTIAILYYNIVLTAITVLVAVVIGVLQLLNLVVAVDNPNGAFWDGVRAAGDRYEVIGGSICGLFLVAGGGSVLLHKPWRRWVEKNRPPMEDRANEEDLSCPETQASLVQGEENPTFDEVVVKGPDVKPGNDQSTAPTTRVTEIC